MPKRDSIEKAIQAIKRLEKYDDYQAAFVFGSAARGDITEHSDLDVNVITKVDNPHIDLLHPTIAGVKLDLTYLSEGQLARSIKQDEDMIPRRIPILAESVILFDKQGHLAELKAACPTTAPKFETKDYAHQKFLVFHANDKVERSLHDHPEISLLSMQIGINELLKIHYGITGHWWVSNKRLFQDLKIWDDELSILLKNFVLSGEVMEKFSWWSNIIDHLLEPIGGRGDISNPGEISNVSKRGLEDLNKI